MRRLLPPVALALALLTGCGGTGLPSETAEALQATVATVVTAVNDGDDDAVRTGLTRLREDVAAATRLDRLSDDRARELLALADEVEAALPEAVAPSPAPSPVPPVEPAPEDDEDDGKGKDGKGKDDEKDD